MKIIDLRSDTVTKPSAAMRAAMAAAEVGDDVYGEDPTVNKLQAMAAEMLGHEAAIFAASGTQTNLMGVMSQCERGDEYIVGQNAHTYRYEGGGAAVLGSIQPQPLDFEADGTLNLEKVAAAIKPIDPHFARTRLLCLENTQAGKALPLEYLANARAFVAQHHLALHLDGARVFNAAVHWGVPISEISRHFDSVSVCLSKGLGTPIGSLLVGSKSLIERARRWRKVLGGGMRQAGMIAAAGIYALENNVARLQEDHDNARALAERLAPIGEIKVDREQTNMVFMQVPASRASALREHLKREGMLIAAGATVRLVTHLDVNGRDIDAFAAAVKQFFALASSKSVAAA